MNYLKKVGAKRMIIMVLGNVFLGMGISIFKFSNLGNDAYNAMVMGLSDYLHFNYANFYVVISVGLFAIQCLVGRHYIGPGTIVNTFLLGYIVSFFFHIWESVSKIPSYLPIQLVIMVIGSLFCSFGISLYQSSDVGVAPYDSMALLIQKKLKKVPYFWCRIATDALCALVGFLSGGLIGVGTLTAAFGFGPFIQFFDIHVSQKIFPTQK